MFQIRQWTLVATTLALSWLLMQVAHECGHLLGAWATGGKVVHEVLHPLAISRTDVQPNPHPLVVVWAGPLVGIILPLAVWGMSLVAKSPESYLLRFFAGFCLIANGAYIGFGSFARIGDCGEMIRNGSSLWLLWLFGISTIPTGLYLWNGLGPQFGFGKNSSGVSRRSTAVTTIGLMAVVVAELVLSGR